MTVTSRNTTDLVGGRPVVPTRGALRPLGLGEVRITDGFWAARQRVNGDATLGHARSWMDRLGWTGNFTSADGGTGSPAPRGGGVGRPGGFKLLGARGG